MASERDQLTELFRILVEHFSKEELRSLCFGLDIEYENLPDKLDGMARELVRYCERHSCIPDLIATGQQLRPDVPWDEAAGVLGKAAPEVPDYSLPKPRAGKEETPSGVRSDPQANENGAGSENRAVSACEEFRNEIDFLL